MERMISAGVRLVHEGAGTVLRPGDAVTFGRNAAAQDPPSGRHVGLGADSALHAHAGTLAWADGGCVVTNTGRWLRLRLTEIGGPGRADLDPGRALRIPWRRTRVEIATGSTITGFEVNLGPLEPWSACCWSARSSSPSGGAGGPGPARCSRPCSPRC